jgi:hypothetical protein
VEELILILTPDLDIHKTVVKNGFDMFFEDGLIPIIRILTDYDSNADLDTAADLNAQFTVKIPYKKPKNS